jgi:quinol monooxygenase YgiN
MLGPIMLIVHVSVSVKPDAVDAFKAASLANARQSVQEPGIARFDVIQHADDPTRFVLVAVYRSAEATACAQRNPPLSRLARHGGRHDGPAALQHEVHERVPVG